MKPTRTGISRRPSIISVPTALALALILSSAALSEVPLRENPETPRDGVRTLQLEELWRAGDEDGDIFFGLIVQVLAGPDGNLYMLDAQLSEIPVFTPDGVFLRTISREGEGPGEIRRAGTMLMMPDGNIGVVQRFPGKLVMITPDGLPAGVVIPGDPTAGGREFLGDVKAVGPDLVMSGSHNTRGENARLRHNYLGRFKADGTLRLEYYARDDAFDFSARSFREADEYFINDGRWDAAPDGTLYAATERDAYRIRVFAPEGPAPMIISRDGPLYRRSGAVKQSLETRWKSTRRYQRFKTEQEFSETEPAISRILALDDEILVLPATGRHDRPEGVFQTWDVFDTKGVFERQLEITCPGDGSRDMIFFVGDDLAIVVAGYQDALDALQGVESGDDSDEGEATPVEIIAYAIH